MLFYLSLLFIPVLGERRDELRLDSLLDAQRFAAHCKLLSSEELEGRGSGSVGQKAAATYISSQFRKLGLEPAGESGTYYQSFPVSLPQFAKVGADSGVEFFFADKRHRMLVNQEFQPFGFSKEGEVQGALVFAGYSITDSKLHYDDFSGVDVKGKIVLALRHTPGESNPESPFGPLQMQLGTFVNKANTAAAAGAVGLLLINDFNHEDDPFVAIAVGGPKASIPVVQISRKIAQELLPDFDLEKIQEKIDESLRPQSFEVPDLLVKIKVDLLKPATSELSKTENIIARLPGSDPVLAREYLVIGAHYDHVGFGEYGASMQNRGRIHPGADDNASGTSGLIELAQALRSLKTAPKRSILFMAFSGEELGLYGSAYYVKKPTVPLDQIVAMINLDMIGRSKDGFLEVSSISTGEGFEELLEKLNQGIGLDLKLNPEITDDSDHASFVRAKIPALFFFTGFHPDYHRPSDTFEKINIPDTLRVLRLVLRTSVELANREERPQFSKK